MEFIVGSTDSAVLENQRIVELIDRATFEVDTLDARSTFTQKEPTDWEKVDDDSPFIHWHAKFYLIQALPTTVNNIEEISGIMVMDVIARLMHPEDAIMNMITFIDF
ncbi:Hypothetical_protein [Hexamita inflata]|uniref:Hypothetical_protein n=1 Tax=Hexamita inflata TaxID=28002 RepID=A0AA86QTW5_9EUKA|nr:Hypothetical protein HINF_LOCUS48322 [Hexamita inflata]